MLRGQDLVAGSIGGGACCDVAMPVNGHHGDGVMALPAHPPHSVPCRSCGNARGRLGVSTGEGMDVAVPCDALDL